MMCLSSLTWRSYQEMTKKKVNMHAMVIYMYYISLITSIDFLIFPLFKYCLSTLVLEELITKVALLKRNCFASVFEKYFEHQQAGNDKEEYAVINYREDETL